MKDGQESGGRHGGPGSAGRRRTGHDATQVRLTHPDRVLYEGQGITKRDLAAYYTLAAGHILPHLAGRPLTVVRCPRGQSGTCFYQRHVNEALPSAVGAVELQEKEGRRRYIVVDDLDGLVGLVQVGALELHPWGSRKDRIERPDRMVFDLDPGPETDWDDVVGAAREVGGVLEDLGLRAFVKTSGGKGLHVVVPLVRRTGWDGVRVFARALAERIAAGDPERYVAAMAKERRRGRVFIDYLRNARSATSVAPYSTRARPGAPVSTPLEWDELDDGREAVSHDITSIPERLAGGRDPWEGFFDVRQSLTRKARRRLGLD